MPDDLHLYPVLIDREFLLRLLISSILGAVIGYERERAHKPAGIRTHILVSAGATLYVFLSTVMMEEYASVEHRMADPNRVLAQVVSGISFLGAGTIIQSRASIHGLTTAASIWVMAAIGSAVGAGEYSIALATTMIAFGVLTMITLFNSRLLIRRDIRQIALKSDTPIDDEKVADVLRRYSKLVKFSEASRTREHHKFTYRVQINDKDLPAILRALEAETGLQDIKAE